MYSDVSVCHLWLLWIKSLFIGHLRVKCVKSVHNTSIFFSAVILEGCAFAFCKFLQGCSYLTHLCFMCFIKIKVKFFCLNSASMTALIRHHATNGQYYPSIANASTWFILFQLLRRHICCVKKIGFYPPNDRECGFSLFHWPQFWYSLMSARSVQQTVSISVVAPRLFVM